MKDICIRKDEEKLFMADNIICVEILQIPRIIDYRSMKSINTQLKQIGKLSKVTEYKEYKN